MTADPIQAAKKVVNKLTRINVLTPGEVDALRVFQAELSRLEGENERLRADNDVRSSCLRDTQLALAEARRQIAERGEALRAAEEALCEYACMVPGSRQPCLRAVDDCARECGKVATEGLRVVREALASPSTNGGEA